MRDFNAEWRRLERAQYILFFAWGFALLGWFSAILAQAFRIPPWPVMGIWLVICGAGCVLSLVGAAIVLLGAIFGRTK